MKARWDQPVMKRRASAFCLCIGRVRTDKRFISFWSARPEVVRIWISLYTPQKDEHTSEMLTPPERDRVADELPALRKRYPKLLANDGISRAIRGAARQSGGVHIFQNVHELFC
jgi:hypothetical protein